MEGVTLATKRFLRLAELREKPHCSWATWLFFFFVVSVALLLRQHLNCSTAAELNVIDLACLHCAVWMKVFFFSGV